MKKFLLSAGLLLSGFSLVSAASFQQKESLKPVDVHVKTVHNNVSENRVVEQLAPGVTISTEHGRKRLHSIYGMESNTLRKTPARLNAAKASLPEGYVLFESFEDWTGADEYWTPDGWVVEMKGKVDPSESWKPTAPGYWDPACPDGEIYFMISYGSNVQDEWLISPYVEVGEGMELSYWLYLEPLWLFVIDSKHINWDTFEFIGEPEVAATLQIWAQSEGEDWVMLRDYFEEYKGMNYRELSHASPSGLEKNQVSLKDFYGKKTRVAFRYVGEDGNTSFIDAIGIGYPTIEDISYSSPFDIQYWGLSDSPYLEALDAAIAIYPPFQPITWTNESGSPDVNYTWTYVDPETHQEATSDSSDELVLTYAPDYSYDDMLEGNLYPSPVLRADAFHCAPTEYRAPYDFFQVGGKPGLTFSGGAEFNPTMLPFNAQNLGLDVLMINDSQVGDMALPVFGYNVNSNQYWLNYSLNGEKETPGDYSHLVGIANLIWPTNDAPMVVNGVNIYCFAQFLPEVEFRVTIYGINSSLSTDYNDLTVIAADTITGADAIRQDEYQKCFMCLPFKFDKPVVVRATEEFPAYFVMFEGFNSDLVEYFSPVQSELPDPDYRCFGYMLNHIDLSNHIDRAPYYSMKPLTYKEDGEYVDCYAAFAFGLYAEYPWLTTDCTGVELPSDGSVVDVALGSYYDGSDLTIEAPEGVNAEVSGRYNRCVLKVSIVEDFGEVSGDIVVKGPGVEVSIPVSGYSSVEVIKAADATVETVYDLAGRRVDAASKTAPGVYVAKYSDGTTRKVVIK